MKSTIQRAWGTPGLDPCPRGNVDTTDRALANGGPHNLYGKWAIWFDDLPLQSGDISWNGGPPKPSLIIDFFNGIFHWKHPPAMVRGTPHGLQETPILGDLGGFCEKFPDGIPRVLSFLKPSTLFGKTSPVSPIFFLQQKIFPKQKNTMRNQQKYLPTYGEKRHLRNGGKFTVLGLSAELKKHQTNGGVSPAEVGDCRRLKTSHEPWTK